MSTAPQTPPTFERELRDHAERAACELEALADLLANANGHYPEGLALLLLRVAADLAAAAAAAAAGPEWGTRR